MGLFKEFYLNESEVSRLAKAHGLHHIAFNHYRDRSLRVWNWNKQTKKFEKHDEDKPYTVFSYGSYAERDQKMKEYSIRSFTYGNVYKNDNGAVFRMGDGRNTFEKLPYSYNGKMILKNADGISGNDITDHTFKDSKGNLFVFDSDNDIFKKINSKKWFKDKE